ncbi:hydrolase [Legionella gresilensis]|uniref:hydrolase n=1 Tax=Legionella gresilensis TaxID=91823 RepID=UPI001041A1F6|nr:hydrolase [Legionella gresilensis]
MLLRKDDSCLLLIDVQEKLIPLIENNESVVERCQWLLRLANDLAVPCLVSEQYPRGLGPTLGSLKTLTSQNTIIEKVHFACSGEPTFKQHLNEINKKQLILIGIEAHVCVLQTALALVAEDYEVFIVVDAVGSRKALDKKYALKRMQQLGITLLTSEMVFFEWVEQAGTPLFKTLSSTYLK